MITVTVWRDAAGRMHGFRSEGHAGYADHGEDIVCAAVSALTQSAVLGLTEHVGASVALEHSPGWLQCVFTDAATGDDPAAMAVLETMVLGLQAIAQQYAQQVRIEQLIAQFVEGRQGQWPS